MVIKDVEVNFNSNFCLKVSFLKIESGEKVAVIGQSGSGKTTFFNVLSGIIDYQGEIVTSKKIVYATQFGDLIDEYSVNTNVLMGAFGNRSFFKNLYCVLMKNRDDLLKLFAIQKLKNQKVKELSGGEKQRVLLARTLNEIGDIYLFDEPTSSLDFKHRKLVIETLCSKLVNKTVVCILHDMEQLDHFERFLLFKDGRIIKDTRNLEELDVYFK